jgi:predicted TIM-barrel fold metal-dependent hydrolase
MADAARLAGDYPDIPLIVNHTGMPRDRDPAGLEVWRQGMRQLAERPNVSVKVSGLGMSEPNWTADSIRPLVLETIDIFGTDRSMFASNFPVDRAFSSFDVLYDAFKSITAGFSDSERRALFHDNAERIYRI